MGFIRAEVISYRELERLDSNVAVKGKALLRVEGKEYVSRMEMLRHFVSMWELLSILLGAAQYDCFNLTGAGVHWSEAELTAAFDVTG